jgi:predicted nucleic acid-binding protein
VLYVAHESGDELRIEAHEPSRADSVPTVDLAIAASALQAGVPLLHADTHFELIAAHCDLRQAFIGG